MYANHKLSEVNELNESSELADATYRAETET